MLLIQTSKCNSEWYHLLSIMKSASFHFSASLSLAPPLSISPCFLSLSLHHHPSYIQWDASAWRIHIQCNSTLPHHLKAQRWVSLASQEFPDEWERKLCKQMSNRSTSKCKLKDTEDTALSSPWGRETLQEKQSVLAQPTIPNNQCWCPTAAVSSFLLNLEKSLNG